MALWYLNRELPKEVAWQNHPDIYHDQVKLSGSCEVYYPNWNHGFDLPNGADTDTIQAKVEEHLEKLKAKGIAT